MAKPCITEFNSDLFWSILIWIENKQAEGETMNKKYKEDLNRKIKKKAPGERPRKWSQWASQRSQKKNKQVNRAIRSKSDYLIKASNPLNGKRCTLLTSTPFSRMLKLSRATAHPWQRAITPVSWRSLALYNWEAWWNGCCRTKQSLGIENPGKQTHTVGCQGWIRSGTTCSIMK